MVKVSRNPRRVPAGVRRRPRLERHDWLDAALDALYEDGIESVKVEPLARRLGVTKGSFYHHFQDHPELLVAMIDRWRAVQEGLLMRFASARAEDPHTRLADIMDFIQAKDSRHDVGVRSWALTNPYARQALQEIDRSRLRLVEQIFESMGFEADAAKLRARLIYFYQVGEHTLSVRDRESLRERLKQLRYELVTRR